MKVEPLGYAGEIELRKYYIEKFHRLKEFNVSRSSIKGHKFIINFGDNSILLELDEHTIFKSTGKTFDQSVKKIIDFMFKVKTIKRYKVV